MSRATLSHFTLLFNIKLPDIKKKTYINTTFFLNRHELNKNILPVKFLESTISVKPELVQ